ncbi:MAG: NigD-like protein [Mediterranea sp.]|jgi:hypothetical protein|nr:NigD-like protein [Mediterranea sp.]
MALLLTACKDDEYHYPSVKLEFVTVQADAQGRIATLIPDDADPLPVSKDRTNSRISASTTQRVLSQYETVGSGATATADIYSLQSLIVPLPKPATDEAYKGGIKHDPVNVRSIWMGRDYLNLILNLKVNSGRTHVFGMVEDTSELASQGIITLSLYHDKGGDAEYYNRQAYLSVPLAQYASLPRPAGSITIRFKYYTYDADGHPVESDKYATPGLTYTPLSL